MLDLNLWIQKVGGGEGNVGAVNVDLIVSVA